MTYTKSANFFLFDSVLQIINPSKWLLGFVGERHIEFILLDNY